MKCDIARGDLRVLAHCHFPKMGLNEIVTFIGTQNKNKQTNKQKTIFEIDSEHFGLFQKSLKDF